MKRSRELREPSNMAHILIFTQRILKFYFDFFMRRAVLLLPALLCAQGNANLLAKFRRSLKGAEFAKSKPHFASSDKFTARKFHFLQEARKFRPLQMIAKFRLSQAALNFKISPRQNGRSY